MATTIMMMMQLHWNGETQRTDPLGLTKTRRDNKTKNKVTMNEQKQK